MPKDLKISTIIAIFVFALSSQSFSEELWHLEKKILGLTCEDLNHDKLKEIITVGPAGEMCVYNYDGTLTNCLPVSTKITRIVSAHLNEDPGPEFVGFVPGLWGIQAFNIQGQALWNYEATNIDDITPIDINQDGLDEIVVGFNGKEGIVLLDSRGEVLWQQGLLTNVWSVTSGDLNQDGIDEIVTTSGPGTVHVLDREGVEIDRYSFRDLEVSFVNVLEVFSDSPGPEIIVSGRGKDNFRGQALVGAINKDFVSFWQVNLGPTALFDSAVANSVAGLPSKGWLAVAADNGTVTVFDRFGKLIFSREDVGRNDEFVSWITDSTGNPILICGGRESGLHAYAIDEEMVEMGEPEIITPPGFVERAQKTGMALNFPYYLLKIGYFCIVTALLLLIIFRKTVFKRKKKLAGTNAKKDKKSK